MKNTVYIIGATPDMCIVEKYIMEHSEVAVVCISAEDFEKKARQRFGVDIEFPIKSIDLAQVEADVMKRIDRCEVDYEQRSFQKEQNRLRQRSFQRNIRLRK